MEFHATSLNPSAIWDENSVYPKKGNGFVFKPLMINIHVEAFINQTLNQDGNETAILRRKFYNPPNLIIQHLAIKENVRNIEGKRMRNG